MIRALMVRLWPRKSLQSATEFAWIALQTSLNFIAMQEESQRSDICQWFLFEKVQLQSTPATNVILEHRNKRPELIHYNRETDVLDVYEHTLLVEDDSRHEFMGLVRTAIVRRNLAMIDDFLADDRCIPFLLLGPTGAAKTLLLRQAVQQHSGYTLLTINCSTQLTSSHVMAILKKVKRIS